MKCHYEVLGIPMNADSEILKKSYRRLALQWHPDKNLENTDEATENFRLIQQAYDVLSDPQERAWYDKHREVIIKGGLGSGDYNDNCLNVFQYFSASCYDGFHDNKNGFYNVYGEVFSKIAAEDMEFANDMDSDFEIPAFGISTSSYEEEVHPFYAHWSSYCTCKSFVWVEKYDTREAPNRRISRLMDKDNKKLRDQARKKRNEEVRALVSFVRKRDKRVQAYKQLLEERAAENAKKSEEIRNKHLLQRQKNLENYKESGWTAMSSLESGLQEIEASLNKEYGDSDTGNLKNGSEGDPDECDDLYCIVCERRFRNVKGLENHLKSRKHKENFDLLKEFMEEEDQENFSCEDIVSSEENLIEKVFDSNIKNELATSDISESHIEDINPKKSPKSKKRNKKTLKNRLTEEDFDYNLEKPFLETPCVNPDLSNMAACQENTASDVPPVKFKGKKAKELRKKLKDKSKIPATDQEFSEAEFNCATCDYNFPTRNKLFNHLKSSGHSVYLPQSSNNNLNNKLEGVKVKKKSKN